MKTPDRRFVVDEVVDPVARAAGLPVFSIGQIADYLTEGYWIDQGQDGRQWAQNNRQLTYNVSALSEERADLARIAFATWADVSDRTFKEVSGTAEINFQDDGSGNAYETDNGQFNGGTITSATINLGANFGGGNALDSRPYQTFVHEIGHALGLGHAGDYNEFAQYSTDAHYANDTVQATVMSYFGQGEVFPNSTRNVLTPQMADIKAMLDLYGADRVRGGDTIYGFDPAGHAKATRAIYDFDNYTQSPAFTIFDTGGVDMLDCSRYNAAQTINLKGGSWSDIGGLTGNIGIYTSSVIENARGGGGADTLLGNNAANRLFGMAAEDRLNGRAGNDRLSGGDNADTFIFQPGSGRDRIVDFVIDVDKIDVTTFDFSSPQAIKSRIDFDQAGAIVDFGGGDRLKIDDYKRGQFDTDHFMI